MTKNERDISRIVTRVKWVIAFLPLLWIVIFWILVLHTFLKVGHWPKYNNPDPKEIGFGLYSFILFFGLFFIWIVSIYSILFNLIEAVLYKDWRPIKNILLVVACNLVQFLFVRLDFWNLMDWLYD